MTAMAVALVGFGAAAWLVSDGNAPATRADVCAQPPKLRTYRGVTLQPEAMKAFRSAQKVAGRRIEVVSSYRSCSEQVQACTRICGNPNGCPGTCVKPGLSYHQLGSAIDLSGAMLDAPGIVRAFTDAGWCQSVPNTDPGHFSFGGCH